jgi:hypothetical protein
MMQLFATNLIGLYSPSAIENAYHAVHAWHVIHGVPWQVQLDVMKPLFRSAQINRPKSSKRPLRQPVQIDFLCKLHSFIDWSDPKSVAFYACITTTYYATARLGEFVVPTTKTVFDAQRYISGTGWSDESDEAGRRIWKFELPFTKVLDMGETVSWMTTNDMSDPLAAFQHHIALNQPNADHFLFSYRDHLGNLTPMSQKRFTSCLDDYCKKMGEKALNGHGLRIGHTLELLLRGVPFEVVKTKGRWSSDSFQVYLQKHELILAPYIQAVPELKCEVARVSMPRVQRHAGR